MVGNLTASRVDRGLTGAFPDATETHSVSVPQLPSPVTALGVDISLLSSGFQTDFPDSAIVI